MRTLRSIPILMGLIGLYLGTPPVSAQTVTVSKSGSPNFSTIQSAIDSFASDSDPAENVILVQDSSVYDEMVTINRPLRLEGSSAVNRPIIAGRNNTAGADALVISIPTGTSNTVTLRNLIVIPSKTTPPTDDGIASVGQNLFIFLDNVLVSANNGSDQPCTSDGLSTPTVTGTEVFIGDDNLFLGPTTTPAGPGTEVLMRNLVSSYGNPAGASNDGIVLSGSGLTYTILDGCVFSFNGRLGIQAGRNFTINAPTKPVQVIYNKGFAGLWFASASALARDINGLIVMHNSSTGIEHQNGGTAGLKMSNAIVAQNGATNLQISDVGINAPINLTNVTISNQHTGSAISVLTTASATITLKDSIVAGNGTADPVNTIVHNGSGPLTITGSALVTAGPNALVAPKTGTGPVSGSPSTTADPQFVNILDPTSPSLYDVANTAYATANSSGGPLRGGADYVGTSTVRDWTLY